MVFKVPINKVTYHSSQLITSKTLKLESSGAARIASQYGATFHGSAILELNMSRTVEKMRAHLRYRIFLKINLPFLI